MGNLDEDAAAGLFQEADGVGGISWMNGAEVLSAALSTDDQTARGWLQFAGVVGVIAFVVGLVVSRKIGDREVVLRLKE